MTPDFWLYAWCSLVSAVLFSCQSYFVTPSAASKGTAAAHFCAPSRTRLLLSPAARSDWHIRARSCWSCWRQRRTTSICLSSARAYAPYALLTDQSRYRADTCFYAGLSAGARPPSCSICLAATFPILVRPPGSGGSSPSASPQVPRTCMIARGSCAGGCCSRMCRSRSTTCTSERTRAFGHRRARTAYTRLASDGMWPTWPICDWRPLAGLAPAGGGEPRPGVADASQYGYSTYLDHGQSDGAILLRPPCECLSMTAPPLMKY